MERSFAEEIKSLQLADGATFHGEGVLAVTKDCITMAGEYNAEAIGRGLANFLERDGAGLIFQAGTEWIAAMDALRQRASQALGVSMPPRPPTFCVGCPERPVFAALKLAERDIGKPHIAVDIGCHALATFEPFSSGNSILGYGMSLASAAGVAPIQSGRALSIMGDGGFWHNGLLSGVSSTLLKKGDSVLIIMKNGYSSATGTQELISTPMESARAIAREKNAVHADQTIENTLRGVDEDVCSGDHSCIRLPGCPSLTVKDSGDPLKVDPVVHVNNSCVGCGLCGEVAHAAILCPSFFRAEIVQNPSWWDRLKWRMRNSVIGWMQPAKCK